MPEHCRECGAPLPENETCQSNFHALLYRENEVGQLSSEFFGTEMGHTAHFYAVSCYAIQHPQSMSYTVEALLGVRANMEKHLDGQASLDTIRQQTRAVHNGKVRVQRRAGDPFLDWQVHDWPYCVADVLTTPATPVAYVDATTRWARATLDAIAAVPLSR